MLVLALAPVLALVLMLRRHLPLPTCSCGMYYAVSASVPLWKGIRWYVPWLPPILRAFGVCVVDAVVCRN